MSPLDADVAFAFLLGELPEAQAIPLEDGAFETPARFEALQAFEVELVDAFLNGALSADRRARFEVRLQASPQLRSKVAFARALKVRAQQHAPQAEKSALARFFEGLGSMRWAFVGGLATAVVLAVVFRPAELLGVDVSLRPMALRGQAGAMKVSVPSSATTLRLELALEGEPARSAWDVVLSNASLPAGAGEVWKGQASRADSLAVHVDVPTKGLVAGLYRVSLRSGGEVVAEYELELSR